MHAAAEMNKVQQVQSFAGSNFKHKVEGVLYQNYINALGIYPPPGELRRRTKVQLISGLQRTALRA